MPSSYKPFTTRDRNSNVLCDHRLYADQSLDRSKAKPANIRDDLLVLLLNGIDVSVIHQNGSVKITSTDGESKTVLKTDWEYAVFRFSSEIRHFYDISAAKTPADDIARSGFYKMLAEWERRHPRGAVAR